MWYDGMTPSHTLFQFWFAHKHGAEEEEQRMKKSGL